MYITETEDFHIFKATGGNILEFHATFRITFHNIGCAIINGALAS